jgi:hypothetical protein
VVGVAELALMFSGTARERARGRHLQRARNRENVRLARIDDYPDRESALRAVGDE